MEENFKHDANGSVEIDTKQATNARVNMTEH